MVSTAEVTRPRLIGAMALRSLGVARTTKMPTIEARMPMAGTIREKARPTWPLAREGGVGQDQGGHQDDDVGLEQVGAHAGAVADVVAHVVGDGGGVAGIVLRDAGLDLADQVGAHVGGLGEDAAADAHEQGQQRSAEAEADQDGGGGVLGQHDDDRGSEQTETHHEHAGDGAGAEGDLEAGGQRAVPGRGRGAHVAPHRRAHADVAGQSGQGGPEQEGQGPEQARQAEGRGRCAWNRLAGFGSPGWR